MIAILEDVRVMEKEIRIDKKDNTEIFIFHCYQRGEKSLIPVKGVDKEAYSMISEEQKVTLKVNLMAWGQNGNYGLAVRYLDILKGSK